MRELPLSVQVILESGRTVAFRVALAEICDVDAEAGLFLSQSLYWYQRTLDPNGFFYKTHKQWREEICLSRSTLDRIRARLVEKGFLEHIVRGCPPKSHYRPRVLAIEKALLQFAEKQQINLRNHNKLICQDARFQSAVNPPSNLPEADKSYKEAQITGESTTKISDTTPHANALSAPCPVETAAATALWHTIQAALKEQVNPQPYSTWIAPLRAVGIRGPVLYLCGPTADFEFALNKFQREIGIALIGTRLGEIRYVNPGTNELPVSYLVTTAPRGAALVGFDTLRILPA